MDIREPTLARLASRRCPLGGCRRTRWSVFSAESSADLLRSGWVLFHLLLDLIDTQVLLLAKCLRVNLGFGNPLLHQKLLGQRGTPLGERLVVGLRSALISV